MLHRSAKASEEPAQAQHIPRSLLEFFRWRLTYLQKAVVRAMAERKKTIQCRTPGTRSHRGSRRRIVPRSTLGRSTPSTSTNWTKASWMFWMGSPKVARAVDFRGRDIPVAYSWLSPIGCLAQMTRLFRKVTFGFFGEPQVVESEACTVDWLKFGELFVWIPRGKFSPGDEQENQTSELQSSAQGDLVGRRVKPNPVCAFPSTNASRHSCIATRESTGRVVSEHRSFQ